jgi:AbrB family looped-hinge helix DNA binding protein
MKLPRFPTGCDRIVDAYGKDKVVRPSYNRAEMRMTEVVLTKMSTKGQIVIPKAMREQMNIKEGDVFAMFSIRDTILLKRIKIPSEESFERLMKEGQEFAMEKGITRDDVDRAIAEVRKGNYEPL